MADAMLDRLLPKAHRLTERPRLWGRKTAERTMHPALDTDRHRQGGHDAGLPVTVTGITGVTIDRNTHVPSEF